jgi:hypothetical protein
MTNHHEIDQLFAQACKLASSERSAWLDEHCTEPEQRAQLDRLMAHFKTDEARSRDTTIVCTPSISSDRSKDTETSMLESKSGSSSPNV